MLDLKYIRNNETLYIVKRSDLTKILEVVAKNNGDNGHLLRVKLPNKKILTLEFDEYAFFRSKNYAKNYIETQKPLVMKELDEKIYKIRESISELHTKRLKYWNYRDNLRNDTLIERMEDITTQDVINTIISESNRCRSGITKKIQITTNKDKCKFKKEIVLQLTNKNDGVKATIFTNMNKNEYNILNSVLINNNNERKILDIFRTVCQLYELIC